MLSILIICRRKNELLQTVRSIKSLDAELLVDISEGSESLGIRKNRFLNRVKNKWVLMLDSDEVVSPGLAQEIKQELSRVSENIHGFEIPYQNYAFGKALHYGGERYSKVRLFRMKFGKVTAFPIHEEIVVDGKIKKLKEKIHHYSYPTVGYVITKFSKYAWQVAGEKRKVHEYTTFKKLFLYGPHMFWARSVEEKGWKDGWQGVTLDLCFAYMEGLSYWLLLLRNMLSL